MKGPYVLGANALLEFVEAGPGLHKVDQLLHSAAREQVTVFISVMNLGEAFYLLWRKRSQERARQTIDAFPVFPSKLFPSILPRP